MWLYEKVFWAQKKKKKKKREVIFCLVVLCIFGNIGICKHGNRWTIVLCPQHSRSQFFGRSFLKRPILLEYDAFLFSVLVI
jgi:hypothetical protein